MKVSCCFCGDSLRSEEAWAVRISPGENEDAGQGLSCHQQCLDDRLHPSVPRMAS